jgi:DNA-binding winged helix-turn-helix (wHTH) protein/Tol biopolymer transport system component
MGLVGRGASRVFRFGAFELRTGTGELCKHGTRIKLQIKPLQILETLLDRPGELVTRHELCGKLWAPGTFVDFESGLNTAVNRLRGALGDSAESPHYIETLPRLGYRFICPVQSIDGEVTVTPLRADTDRVADADRVHEGTRVPVNLCENTEATAASPIFVSASHPPLAAEWKKARVIGTVLLSGATVFGLLHLLSPHHGTEQFSPVGLKGEAVIAARFLPCSRIVYSTSQNGERQTFVADVDGTNGYALPIAGTIASVSRNGDFAMVSRDPLKPGGHPRIVRSSVNGRRTETLAEDASVADWSPEGKRLALVREVGSESLVEYPKGKMIFRSQGWIDSVRVSPSGREIAFLEHPVRDDDGGHVRVINAAGNSVLVTKDWGSAAGLAWSASGDEVWFTASNEAGSRTLYAVSRSGRLRKLTTQPQSLRLLDVSSSGHALLAIDDVRMTMRAAVSANEAERDISQFDFSHIEDISRDGDVLLFTEAGDAGGQHYQAYVYDQRCHGVKRLGPGRGLSLSPDGKEALTVDPQDRTALSLVQVNSGRSIKLPQSAFRYQWARFFKPGQLLVGGAYPSQPLTICLLDEASGKLVAVPDAPYLDYVAISPDRRKIAGRLTGRTEIFDLATKTTHRLLPESPSTPVVWSADSEDLFLVSSNHSEYSILKLNVATERSATWRTIVPHSSDAFMGLSAIVAAPASGAYAYSSSRESSRLYLVHGLG